MSHNRIIATTLVALGCTTLVGTLFAQSLQITSTIDNAIIMVRNIFLSPSGRDTSNASIKLEGDQGNVTIGGDLVLSNARYSCPDSDGTGCVFAVQPDGSTALTEVALPQATTVIEDDVTITGDSFFAKKGGSTDHLNRSANEIVFADPDIVPNAADAHLRVNIKDVVRATSTGTPKMFDVNGAINSRTSLEVSSPLDTTQKSNYNLTNTARTDFILTKGDSATNEQSVRMKVGYNNGAQYTRQDMIIDSLGATGAKLGINTASYPEYTLDVNGETLSQETLTIGYLNSGNIVTNIRQAVGIVIQNPSPSAQTAIRSQSCDRAPIPATLQCSNGNCSTISLSGNEIASFTCYDWVGTNTTMQRAQMYQIMSLYSSVTMIANTDTQSVGINTLVPQSTLDVNGDTYLDGSGYIVGTPNNIASVSNGNTSIQLKELNNTESTPYTGGNTNCKGLSVDEAGHIILVQLPRTMCGATGSIVTPPTPVINGVCGSSHNTTGTSAPTTNLCMTGTASSIAGSGPWTWSCAGSNGGTSASCQMNKQTTANSNEYSWVTGDRGQCSYFNFGTPPTFSTEWESVAANSYIQSVVGYNTSSGYNKYCTAPTTHTFTIQSGIRLKFALCRSSTGAIVDPNLCTEPMPDTVVDTTGCNITETKEIEYRVRTRDRADSNYTLAGGSPVPPNEQTYNDSCVYQKINPDGASLALNNGNVSANCMALSRTNRTSNINGYFVWNGIPMWENSNYFRGPSGFLGQNPSGSICTVGLNYIVYGGYGGGGVTTAGKYKSYYREYRLKP